jgi:hypothetical protein
MRFATGQHQTARHLPKHRRALRNAALLSFAALLLPGCRTASGPQRDDTRRTAHVSPAVRVVRDIVPPPPCPLPNPAKPARWYYEIATRMRRGRDRLADAAVRARRIRDRLLHACLRAKARVATDLMAQVATELQALRQQHPPDPGITRRVLARCEQLRGLERAARRCLPLGPRPLNSKETP